MAISERYNQSLMKAIKRMHTLVESDDLDRVRASQENISTLLKNRELNYEPFQVGEIPAEWVSVKRSHMKKFVIFYCHGGGYNTGSYHYARSIIWDTVPEMSLWQVILPAAIWRCPLF